MDAWLVAEVGDNWPSMPGTWNNVAIPARDLRVDFGLAAFGDRVPVSEVA